MENLSIDDAEQLMDEILAKIPKSIDRAIAAIGIRAVQTEPIVYGVGILVTNPVTVEDVLPYIPDEKRENVIIRDIGSDRIEAL